MNKRKKVSRAGLAKKNRNKKIIIDNYEICDSWFSKVRGLMFRPKKFKTPLLFIFEKPGRYPIHSFFCRKFLAVWFLDGKLIDKKIVESWKTSICPTKKFDRLVEIPL